MSGASRWSFHRRGLQVAGFVVSLAVTVAGCGAVDRSGVVKDSTPPDPGTQPAMHSDHRNSHTRPLDDVPGFGRSRNAALRDDTIAYFEAWQRDTIVAACMEEHGFAWRVEVLYPNEEARAVADALEVDPAEVGHKIAPEDWNREHESSLSASRRNDYLLALYGETSEAIDHWRDSEGDIPDGRDPRSFAKRGCSERGWKHVPGVWSLRDKLDAEWTTLRARAEETDAFHEAASEYTKCLAEHGFPGVDSPAELERAVLAGELEQEGYTNAVGECHAHWKAARDAGMHELESAFRERHAGAIRNHQRHYARVLERMKDNAEFRAHLATVIAGPRLPSSSR